MSLSEKTKRSVVGALNTAFDTQEVNALLESFEDLQAFSPVIRTAAPNLSLYIPGVYYDPAFTANGVGSSYNAVANNIDLIPFVVPTDLRINQFTIGVLTDAAASNARVVVYEADENYTPARKVYESANISTAAIATPTTAVDFVFNANTLYWIGVHTSGTPVLRGMSLSSVLSLGTATAGGSGSVCVRKAATFGSAPSQWSFLPADLTFAAPPSVRFRVA